MLPMLRTILASVFKPPATIPFPPPVPAEPRPVRGHVSITVENCIFCGICKRGCPTGTIAVDRAAKTWAIDPFDCVLCGYCVEACPKKCLGMEPGLSRAGDRAAREERLDARIPDNA